MRTARAQGCCKWEQALSFSSRMSCMEMKENDAESERFVGCIQILRSDNTDGGGTSEGAVTPQEARAQGTDIGDDAHVKQR